MTNPPTPPGEFDLISRYFAPLTRSLSGAANLTDDTATLSISPGHESVLTMDTMVAGIHFLADDPPDLVARKLLRVNLSDLASSGARPVTYLLAMSLPKETAESWVADFARGLGEDQEIFDVALSGGDTTVIKQTIGLHRVVGVTFEEGRYMGDDIPVAHEARQVDMFGGAYRHRSRAAARSRDQRQ